MRRAGMVLLLVLVAGCQPDTARLTEQGVRQFQTGQVEQARESFERVFRIAPSNPVALYYLGRLAQQEGFYERAVYYYESALDADPGMRDARRWLARAREELDRSREAAGLGPRPGE